MSDARCEDVQAINLHVRTLDDRWHHPGKRYCVARRGMAVVPFRLLSEAKAWVVEQYGPMTWEKRPRPRYNEVRRLRYGSRIEDAVARGVVVVRRVTRADRARAVGAALSRAPKSVNISRAMAQQMRRPRRSRGVRDG